MQCALGLAHRAAASLLSMSMGQVVRCGVALRVWRLNVLRSTSDERERDSWRPRSGERCSTAKANCPSNSLPWRAKV